ncbi:MAG: hypothetical protein RMI94_05210 [Bryobacterales bacterium]|nr:hypothetical protein [Bryobacteraceae bacterium]MDW8129927.1 hypothetical protein [Bryobacterales bacterium]
MLAWWLILAEVGAARARATPVPSFLQELRLEGRPRWPCLLASGLLHLTLVALLPALGDWLQATRPEHWVHRYRMLPSVEVRVPERMYLAAARPTRLMRSQPRAAARQPRGRTAAPESPSSGASGTLRRRFELPPMPARATDQTLLQPDFPAELPALARLSLPDLFFWAPVPNHPAFRVRKPFVTPGSAEPFAQPPALDAPPQLAVPNWEAIASVVQAASGGTASPDSPLLPAISMPIRLMDWLLRPPKTHVSVESAVGDPLSVLALNQRVRPVREELAIPPGSQLAQGEPVAGRAVGPDAGSGHDREGERAGAAGSRRERSEAEPKSSASGPESSGIRERPAATDRDSAATAPATTPDRRFASAEPAPNSAATHRPSTESIAGSGSPGRASEATPTLRPPQRQEEALRALRIEHPPGGVADVVVVQPAPMDGIFDAAGALSGRPVYTVFLHVGAARHWILQYCVPGEDQSISVTDGVLRLAQPSPLLAPYPRITYLPTLRPRPNSYLFVHGYLNLEGRFENLQAVRNADRDEVAGILPVLERWEFRPAMRHGQPVRVEILLAIPRL